MTRMPVADEPRRRILFVHHRSELGGAPTSLSYLLAELDRNQFEPHVYCPGGLAAELFRESGATVHEGPVAGFTHIWASTYGGRRWLLFVREVGRLPFHLFKFDRLLKRGRFDIVHLNDSPMLPAAWLARRRRVPVVWHLRSALPEGGGRRSRLVRGAVARLSDMTIAINRDVAEIWDLPAHVVPNSVELERFRPGDPLETRERLGLAPDKPVVAYFGFLYPAKGFREFIQAAALLRGRGVDATYLIVGGGVRGEEFFRTPLGRLLRLFDLARNYDAEARRLVSELELEDSVRFVPFTRETEELYRASAVVVAPSQGPEIGRPMIEAAASGVAVIGTGTRTGGGILEPGITTLLADDYRAEALTEQILALLIDEGRRDSIGIAARTHALAMFDPVRNARLVEALYEKLVPSAERVPVLFVHHRPQLGGAPTSLAQLVRHLDTNRYVPHVFVPDGPSAKLFADAGAVVHVGPASIFAHAWDNPYSGLRWLVLGREFGRLWPHIHALNRVIKRYPYPIVHLNDSPLLPAAWVARRRGAKVVWHLRSALAANGDDRRSRAIARLIDRWGEAAIAIDQDVAARFRVHLPIRIVHNSVSLPDTAGSQSEPGEKLGIPPERIAIGYVGFVRSQKGWPDLVRAIRRLVDDDLPVHLVIVGGGVRPPSYFKTFKGKLLEFTGLLTDEESAIRRLVAELGLDEHVTFLPFRPGLGTVYNALDVVTFPNPGVGLGRPVLEAAAYGKPVVASGSADGAGVLLPEQTGILLAQTTPESIAAALRRLIVDPELRERLGAAAARHARTSFDPERNVLRIERIYDELLRRERRGPARHEETRRPPVASRV